MLLDKEIGHEIHQKNHCSAHWNSFLSYIAYFLLGSGAPLSFFGPILSGYTYLTYVIITTILGACIAAILKLFKLGFTKKKPTSKVSKISAILGFLALVFLNTGAIGGVFAVVGSIFSIVGMLTMDPESRKAAIYSFVANLATLVILSVLAWVGLQHV